MKELFKNLLGILFWVALVFMCGAAEAGAWGTAFLILAGIIVIFKIFNKLVEDEPDEKDNIQKREESQC